MYVNMHACTYVKVHIYIHINTYGHTYIQRYMHTCIGTHVDAYVQSYTWALEGPGGAPATRVVWQPESRGIA